MGQIWPTGYILLTPRLESCLFQVVTCPSMEAIKSWLEEFLAGKPQVGLKHPMNNFYVLLLRWESLVLIHPRSQAHFLMCL